MEAVLDYGMRLFRHVVQQVFGNLAQAARITALPAFIFFVGAYLIAGDLIGGLLALDATQTGTFNEDQIGTQFGSEEQFLRQMLQTLWLIPLGMVMFAWAAVAWHRYVLAEEYGGMVPAFSGGRVMGYVWRTILITLLLILVLIPVMFVLGGMVAAAATSGGGFGFGLLLTMGLSFLFSWILVRWSLILPAWSVDEKMTIGESWNVTKDVSGEILVPILGFAIIFPAIQQVILVLPQGIVAIAISVFVSWIQMLVNLALLTTLYGNLVQGRELN